MTKLVWQNFTPVTFSGKYRTKLSVPAFDISSIPAGLLASIIILEFHDDDSCLPDKFSLVMPQTIPDGVNFVFAVRWIDTNGNVQRRKLWEDIGEDFSYTLYNGETIDGTTFALEVWNLLDGSEVSSADIYYVLSNILVEPELCCQNIRDTFAYCSLTTHDDLFSTFTFPYVYTLPFTP